MAEALKHLYTQELVSILAREVRRVNKDFDAAAFVRQVFSRKWPGLELKARMAHISRCLHDFLPHDFPQALEILKQTSLRFDGFEYMFFPGFVELYGQEEYDISVKALEHFTPRASAEFAVRPFIIRYGATMMAQMHSWADSQNQHVRRLASEGCRPRLPWAMALPMFKQDPAPILPILEKLKNDESEYVRRSVANNLNDISKDHPGLVLELGRGWHGANAQTDHLLKHAMRGLLKQGQPEALALFGYLPPDHISIRGFSVQRAVSMGDSLAFSFSLSGQQQPLGRLRVEYAIDFLRKNGQRNRKVFKLSEAEYTGREKSLHKTHSFHPISTRKYYPGEQGLSIFVNGHELANSLFELKENG